MPYLPCPTNPLVEQLDDIQLGVQAERERGLDIVAMCAAVGRNDLATHYIGSGLSSEEIASALRRL